MTPVRYATQTGDPCPRTMRADGTVQGDGACHSCGLGAACPLYDPWAETSFGSKDPTADDSRPSCAQLEGGTV